MTGSMAQNEQNEASARPLLQHLPPELLSLVTRFLAVKDALALAMTCQRHHGFLTDFIYTRQLRHEPWSSRPLKWAVDRNVLTTAERCLRLGADPDEQLASPDGYEMEDEDFRQVLGHDQGQLEVGSEGGHENQDASPGTSEAESEDESEDESEGANEGVYGYADDDDDDDDEQRPSEMALLTAIRKSYHGMTLLLLKYGADPCAPTAKYSPFTLASWMGFAEVIKEMLSGAGSPTAARRMANLRDSDGLAPLHRAASMSRDDVVRLLLDHGANIEARTTLGDTPLLEAAAGGWPTTVQLLLRAGADPWAINNHGEQLYSVALLTWHSDVDRVIELLELIITTLREPLPPPGDAAGRQWRLPLRSDDIQHFLSCGFPSVVQLLLDSGADADVPSGVHMTTALWEYAGVNLFWWTGGGAHLHRKRSHIQEIVEILLDAGADANFRAIRDHGTTPLMRAAKVGNLDITKLLLTRGRADMSVVDDDGLTVLDHGEKRQMGSRVAAYLKQYRNHDFAKGAP